MPRTSHPPRSGQSCPLRCHPREGGINFAVWSPAAEAVELCLYDAKGEAETQRLAFREHEGGVWHGFLAGAKAV